MRVDERPVRAEVRVDERGGARLSARAFGQLRLASGSEVRGVGELGGSKPKQLLEILISARGHPVPKDRLIALLWDEDPPQRASAALESYVSVLRRNLTMDGISGHEIVVTVPGGYQLGSGSIDLDLDRFDALVERSRGEHADAALVSLQEALALVAGPVFEDEPEAGWARRMRDRYAETVQRARLDAADGALAHREFRLAREQARVVAEEAPSNERACRMLMLASYASGEQEPALTAYLETRRALQELFGVDPLPETQELYLAILRQDPVERLLPRDVRRTETGFRRLVEQRGATIWWTTDRHLRVTSVSGETDRILGIRPASSIGSSLADLFPGPHPPVVGAHGRALRGEAWTGEVTLNGRDLQVHLEPLLRGEETVGVVGIALDVTERNEIVSTLETMSQQLQAQYEGIPIPTYTWERSGEDFVLVAFNDAAERASEGMVHQFVGGRAAEIYRDEPEIMRDIERAWSERTTIQRSMRYYVPELDRETHLQVTYVFIPPDRIVVHTEDHTKRHEMERSLEASQEGLRALVDRSSDAIFIIDPVDDRILDANERAAELVGFTRDDLLQARPSDLHPEEMARLLAFMEDLEEGRVGWTDEFTVTTRDGLLRRVEIAATKAPYRGRSAVINQISPIELGREADPTLLDALSASG